MTIYTICYGHTFDELLEEIDVLIKGYNMSYEVVNFQETRDRFIAFLKLEKVSNAENKI